MSSNRERVIAAYNQAAKGVKLPTTAQVSALSGMSVRYCRDTLKAEKLPYDRFYNVTAAAEVRRRARDEKDIVFRKHYEEIVRRAGRYPYAKEMQEKMGYRTTCMARTVSERLGLPLTRMRARREAEPEALAEPIRRSEPVRPFGGISLPKMNRILEIKASGDPAKRPARHVFAGEGYEITDRIMLTCPVCGARKLIAPRMHPFWLRNQENEVIFVDKEACSGRLV